MRQSPVLAPGDQNDALGVKFAHGSAPDVCSVTEAFSHVFSLRIRTQLDRTSRVTHGAFPAHGRVHRTRLVLPSSAQLHCETR